MTKFNWTNQSVALFAKGDEPVAAMEAKARQVVLEAIDAGWDGPPFDPLVLAKQLGIATEARGDIPDARMVPFKSALKLEYNPVRPRGRLRFSIAHEIAHSFFPDCANEVRNRGATHGSAVDDWELEVLCNIGAAELLMPLGSFTNLTGQTPSIDNVLRLRKEFDVSVEACLIRTVKLSRKPVAAFCASEHSSGKYKLDYVIAAPGWRPPVGVGTVLPKESVVHDVSAIGYTTVGKEVWGKGAELHVECIGLAPYPGQLSPRVVGLLFPKASKGYEAPELKEIVGNALKPAKRNGTRIVAHVVPDINVVWGGGGFASQVRKTHTNVFERFRADVAMHGGHPKLGSIYRGEIDDETLVVHMVAQHGIGPSREQRLRYAALGQCLTQLCEVAQQKHATVHMPRIGTGYGGASWNIVRELITIELVDKGVETSVYQRPS